MSVVDVLATAGGGSARPDATALFDAVSGERLTWAALSARVDGRGGGAAVRGAEVGGPGHGATDATPGGGVVRFLSVEPDIAGIVALLACWRRGEVPVVLNPKLTDAERRDAEERLAGAVLPPATQVVLWTSGTSGRPRGVALSWDNLLASARSAEERLGLSADDVWLASLSPAHVGGLALLVRSVVLGGTLVTAGAFDVARVSALLDEGPLVPTHVSLVPTQLLRLLDFRDGRAAPQGLKCVLIGGAHAPAGLVERALSAGWPIALTYGATEMSSQIATAPPAMVRGDPGTVGLPMPGVEVRIASDGEIRVRGATRALGYVGAGVDPTLGDGEGWYGTGDLGRLDDRGRLWITGRRSDRIVSGGVTIDAHEVEEALRAHPTVVDVCVVGIPDDEWGERVGAWVEPVVGEFDVERVETWLRGTLTAAKLPRVWYVEGSLPRNANGKVDRTAVRRALSRR